MKYFFKILIASPINDTLEYCQDGWIKNILNFSYPHLDIFLCDTSLTNKNYKYLTKQGIKTEYIRPKSRDKINLDYLAYESCRQTALRTNADFLFFLHPTILPIKNIIEILLSKKKNVIASPYYIFSDGTFKMNIKNIIDPGPGHKQIIYYLDSTNTEQFFIDGNVKKVFYAGLDCLLIHKSILDEVSFIFKKNVNLPPDMLFFTDLYRKNIPVFVDTSVICESELPTHSKADGMGFGSQHS